jgi:hypothetical protein
VRDGFGLGLRPRLRVVVARVRLDDHERQQDGVRNAEELERLIVVSKLVRETLVPRAAPRRPEEGDGHRGDGSNDNTHR